MSWTDYYTANFTNEQGQTVEITISKKDASAVTVVNYDVTQCSLTDNGDDQTKYGAPIISREMTLGLWVPPDDTALSWETFLDAQYDEWKIIMTIDGQKYFEGFIEPDYNNCAFQDKPYEVVVKGTGGLALLKDVPLTDVTGVNFVDDNTIISYIAGALKKTGLDLPIRIYCGYLHTAMLNKGNALTYDMFNQTYLNYRTFQSDAVTFLSCYDTLKRILGFFCRLEYWNGMWQIMNMAELQYYPGDLFYVDYDSDGNVTGGAQVTENYAQIGKDVDIYPINEDQVINSRFALKSVKTIFNYTPWPEIPKNNKFQRGADIPALSGATTRAYAIDDWTYGNTASINTLPLVITSDSKRDYRLDTLDAYGKIASSEILLETDNSALHVLECEGMPVSQGDKYDISFDIKLTNNISPGTYEAAVCYLIGSSGTKYTLDDNGLWNTGAAQQLTMTYSSVTPASNEYNSKSISTQEIPEDGTLYFAFQAGQTSVIGTLVYLKNISINYTPNLPGGAQQVKGDYWYRDQTTPYQDTTEDEVYISDSIRRMLQGAMIFKNDSVDELTTPEWYRFNQISNPNPTSEAKGFKELLNIARYNHSWRRMWALDGSFNGLNYAPENDQLNKQPIGFHKRYREVDLPTPREFVLVPPLTMDIVRGWTTANLVEVINTANSDDGTQIGDTSQFNYVF